MKKVQRACYCLSQLSKSKICVALVVVVLLLVFSLLSACCWRDEGESFFLMCVGVVLFASSKIVCKQREMLQTKEEGKHKARVAAVFECVHAY